MKKCGQSESSRPTQDTLNYSTSKFRLVMSLTQDAWNVQNFNRVFQKWTYLGLALNHQHVLIPVVQFLFTETQPEHFKPRSKKNVLKLRINLDFLCPAWNGCMSLKTFCRQRKTQKTSTRLWVQYFCVISCQFDNVFIHLLLYLV